MDEERSRGKISEAIKFATKGQVLGLDTTSQSNKVYKYLGYATKLVGKLPSAQQGAGNLHPNSHPSVHHIVPNPPPSLHPPAQPFAPSHYFSSPYSYPSAKQFAPNPQPPHSTAFPPFTNHYPQPENQSYAYPSGGPAQPHYQPHENQPYAYPPGGPAQPHYQPYENQSYAYPHDAPVPPPGAIVRPSEPHNVKALLSQEMLVYIPTRAVSARARFGATAVLDARKGLSRILDASNVMDIQYFGDQLKRQDQAAIEGNWTTEDRVPIFALSYVQRNPAVGRFKFDEEQWQNFLNIVQEMSASGVKQFRVWLDQCLWLRDASQGSWAHTGLLPYVIWPVICLGTKRMGGEKSVESGERMWPFVEELAGLWGMGTVFGRELRSKDLSSGARKVISLNVRHRLEPEKCMRMLLLNIFHGAVDMLKTGWVEDVEELKEMAKANVMIKKEEDTLFVGSDWKQRIAQQRLMRPLRVVDGLTFPPPDEARPNMYIDASRTIVGGGWNGLRGFLSGHVHPSADEKDLKLLEENVTKWNIITNHGEFQLLKNQDWYNVLWLLVAMDGPTSNFSRGKVAWTKVMTGVGSSQLSEAFENENTFSVAQILSSELQRNVHITTLNEKKEPIEWE